MEVSPHSGSDSVSLSIDFGTSNTVAYYLKEHSTEPQPLVFGNGSHHLPSFVEYRKDGQPPIVGSVAKYDFGSSNRSVIARVKRVIGHYYNDREIQPFIDCFGAPVVESHGKACFSLSPSGRIITPVDVVSDILQSVIHTAEQVTGSRVGELLVTYPAHFNNNQRTAVLNAVVKAGILVQKVRMLNEPTAAAIAYCIQNQVENNRVLVYDLGGGTFDVSLLRFVDGEFHVETYDGNDALGGADIDQLLAEWLEKQYELASHRSLFSLPSVSAQRRTRRRLLAMAEAVKEELALRETVEADLSFLAPQGGDVSVRVTRDTLATLVAPVVEETVRIVRRAMARVEVTVAEVGHVVLVGGSCRLLPIRERLAEEFGEGRLQQRVSPDECVALGGCLALRRHVNVSERITYSLGQLVNGGRVLWIVPRWQLLPARSTAVTCTTADYMVRANTGVFQGLSEESGRTDATENCIELQSFSFGGFQCKKEGEVEFETTYDIQQNGIVYVTIIEKKTRKVLVKDKMICWED